MNTLSSLNMSAFVLHLYPQRTPLKYSKTRVIYVMSSLSHSSFLCTLLGHLHLHQKFVKQKFVTYFPLVNQTK